MASNDDLNVSETENLCVVCFKSVEIYSIGVCDHPVCYECSTRMRVLCQQNECPICRRDMPKIVFTKEVRPFADIFPKYQQTHLQDRKYGLLFASQDIQRAYQRLLEYCCNVCSDGRKFAQFQQLKDHMRREHSLAFCDLCVDNLKIFCFERRCYTRQELGYHRRKGDPDNTSHRGHPLCEFCDTRYMDSDELFRHLRRNHLFCHFCDGDGKHQYYSSMDDLRKHFRDEHFLCEEGECKSMPLIAVYRTDIDLKAHIATEHSRFMSKSATKQARTLELEFTLAPRSRTDRSKRPAPTRMERHDEEGAVGYDFEPGGPGGGGVNSNSHQQRNNVFVNSLTAQDFPALGNSTVTVQTRPTTTVNFTTKLSPFSGEDFPSLGGSSRAPAVTITTNSLSTRKPKGPEVTITRTMQGQQALKKNNQNFPSLGHVPSSSSSSSSSTSTVRLSMNNSTPKVSIQVNHNSNGAITTHITTNSTPLPATEAFPALGGTATAPQQPQWVQQRPKVKPEPKQMKVNPAPQLPPSDLSQFPSLTKNKKKSSVTVPVNNSWIETNKTNSKTIKGETSSTSKQSECEVKNNKNKKKKKNNSASNNNNYYNNNNNNNNYNNTTNNALMDSGETAKNNNINGIVKKRSELKIGNLSLNDSPSCSNIGSNEAKPPPGFPSKPPPGLNTTNFPSLGNDLTFTNSSGQSYSITPSSSSSSSNYHQPLNFTVRNQNLIKQFMAVLNNDTIREFKNYSDLFRSGNLTGENYYQHCESVMNDRFDELFPELLVLLPDIRKQQELYEFYNGPERNNLIVCENCKQIIYKNELTDHYNYHTLDSHFPSLGKAMESHNVWKK